MNEVSPFAKNSWAFELALTLLSLFCYLAQAFIIFAPLPILYLHQGNPGRRYSKLWILFAALLGLGICSLTLKPSYALGYLFLVILPAFVMGEFLSRKKSPEMAVSMSILGICLAIFFSITLYCAVKNYSPLHYVQSTLTESIRGYIEQFVQSASASASEAELRELEIIRKQPELILEVMPGLILSGILALCIIPLIIIIRWNPKGFQMRTGIPRDFLRRWRAPEWLIWPTILSYIVSAELLPVQTKILPILGKTVLLPLLVIYFFQGMSILEYFMDLLRLRGFVRMFIYLFGIIAVIKLKWFFVILLIIGFGMADLWIVFRKGVRSKQ